MIASLAIENIALIENLRIELEDGLNVLTGETGAGKSIIVDAMNLVLGERAEKSLIRHGADSARVEALICTDSAKTEAALKELGIEAEGELVVERSVSASGRSRCRINGHSVTLAVLKYVMDTLVDLHGQHEHQSLLYPSNHAGLLDDMRGRDTEPIKEEIRSVYAQMRAEAKDLEELGGSLENRQDTMDFLSFQIKELEDAQIVPGELEERRVEQTRIEKAEDMDRDLHLGYGALYEGSDGQGCILETIRGIMTRLEKYSDLDTHLFQVVESMKEAYYTLDDASTEFSRVIDNLFVDDERRQIVEDRIDEIETLLRKYRAATEEQLLEHLAQAKEKLEQLQKADERHQSLSASIEAKEQQLSSLYDKLSSLRREAAEQLTKGLLLELADLGMENAQFSVQFSEIPPDTYGPSSPESAEFLISVNAGEPLKPLSKVASGGEISRIMLAFKVLTASHDGIETLIFDEVDTGISGHVAQIVAEKMAQIALRRQVITVTHLPQIAAAGDQNFYIHKETEGERTNTYIEPLDAAGKRTEIARLAGGLDSRKAQAHAQEMMDNARALKKRAAAKTQSQERKQSERQTT